MSADDGVVDAEIIDDLIVPTVQGYHATWAVRHAETLEPGEPLSGWLDVQGDSTRRLVELGGCELEPEEARALAQALVLAAGHAEDYPLSVCRVINDLRSGNLSDRMGDQPNEVKRAAHDAVQKHGNEAWSIHAQAVAVQRERQEETARAMRSMRGPS